jgi:hypothetical protein
MEAIVVSYRLTPEEFWEAQRLTLRLRTTPGRRVFRVIMLLAIVALVVVQFWLGGTDMVFGAGLLIAVLVAWVVLLYVYPRRASRKQYDTNRGLQVITTLEIAGEGLHFRNEINDIRVSWKAFLHALESETLFILYVSSAQFYPLPKRAFAEADIPRFRALIEQNVRAE